MQLFIAWYQVFRPFIHLISKRVLTSKNLPMSQLLTKLQDANPIDVKKAFIAFVQQYLAPAYGSISKRDIDIELFIKLQELEAIADNPDLYDLVTQLRVTRSKARNLLYESMLRRTTREMMDEELRRILLNPILMKDGQKIMIEIGNPYLIDHMKARLKEVGHIADGSFSPEIVRLPLDAFAALFDTILPGESKTALVQAFVDIGAKPDTSFKGIITGALGALGKQIASEAGSEAGKALGDFLAPLASGAIDTVKQKFGSLFLGDNITH